MSKYTTEVRFICENAAGLDESVGYSDIDTILDASRDSIFDFDFPIFDENYRASLENKILLHYYTREIGAESVGLWKLWLRTRLNEIMPYYNLLYESALIEFNPMYDVDLTTDYQKVDNGTNNDTGTMSESRSGESETNVTGSETTHGENTTTDGTKNDHWEYFSDTPEGGIDGVENMDYLTTALHTTDDRDGSVSSTEVDGSSSNSGNTDTEYSESISRNTSNDRTIRNVQDYLHHVVGKTGGTSYSKMLKEYRETFMNIDMMVVEELGDLFMTVW